MAMPRLSVASSSKPSTNSPMIRKTRHGSVCVNSSGRGLSSNCSSCVVPGAFSPPPFSFFSILIRAYLSVKLRLNTHDVIAAIDVDDLAGDSRRHRATQEHGCVSDFAALDVATKRRALRVMFEHRAEVGDAASRERLNRTGADSIDADVSWAEILCEIASAGFECCLRHAHHVVSRNDFLSTVIRHRDNASAFSHQRRSGARELWQRVSTDFESSEKSFARRVQVFAAECFTRCEGDAVDEEVETAKLLADLPKCFIDFFLFSNVA